MVCGRRRRQRRPGWIAEVLPLFVFCRDHVGDGVDEQVERENVELGGSGQRLEHFDGEPRDGGNWFEEVLDHVLALGEQRVAESLQDERCEVDEIHLGEGDVGREFIGGRLVVQQLCDSPVAW